MKCAMHAPIAYNHRFPARVNPPSISISWRRAKTNNGKTGCSFSIMVLALFGCRAARDGAHLIVAERRHSINSTLPP